MVRINMILKERVAVSKKGNHNYISILKQERKLARHLVSISIRELHIEVNEL